MDVSANTWNHRKDGDSRATKHGHRAALITRPVNKVSRKLRDIALISSFIVYLSGSKTILPVIPKCENCDMQRNDSVPLLSCGVAIIQHAETVHVG
jgi:hypothetical protein